MALSAEAIEAAKLKILEAAQSNNFELSCYGKSHTTSNKIEVNRKVLGDSDEERLALLEAFDRMLNDLNWIRRVEGTDINYKMTESGMKALVELKSKNASHLKTSGAPTAVPTSKRCCVILTALPLERDAIFAHLTSLREVIHKGTIYKVGSFESWEVAVAIIGAGNNTSSLEAERAIEYFKADFVFFVGVAGGIKDVELGDVVASTKVYGYESGKVTTDGFVARPDVGQSAYNLVQRAYAVEADRLWQGRIRCSQKGLQVKPKVVVGPIAAGEKVIASNRSDIFKFLKQQYNDTVAVEMEGRGFLCAAHANHGVMAMIVRGVSDLLSDKEAADQAGWQPIAAANAAAFTFEMIYKLGAFNENHDSSLDAKSDGGIDGLIQDASNPSIKLSHVLTKAYSTMSSLIKPDDKEWLRCEISGYEAGQENTPVWPEYRNCRGEIVTTDSSGRFLPVSFTPKLAEVLADTPLTASIGLLEYAIEQNAIDPEMSLEVSYQPETETRVLEALRSSNPHRIVSATKVTRVVGISQLIAIVEKTRSRFIDLLLALGGSTAKAAEEALRTQSSLPHSSLEVIQKFLAMPALMRGSTVNLKVKFLGKASAVSDTMSKALGLSHGASVCRKIEILVPANEELMFQELDVIYADIDRCQWLYEQSEGSEAEVTVSLAFGTEVRTVEIPSRFDPLLGTFSKTQTKTQEQAVRALVLV